jgi:adenine-specific DNA-methyltransferase
MNPETHGVKYIGSKAALIPYILKCIDENIPPGTIQRTIDVFTGTTRVAQAFKSRGWHVQTSDLSPASACYSGAWIGNESENKHLGDLVKKLNTLSGHEGWLTKNYCDARGEKGGIVRVWQAKNGKRADSIRDQIDLWYHARKIAPWEKDTLVTSLILALDKVDNTVGVQQAYLKDWCTRSHNDLILELPKGVSGPQGKHIQGNCLEIQYEMADLAYLDPPYSSHSYATYYHIWDSIALWDKPEVGLKTNRRADRISGHVAYDAAMASDWNSKRSALAAFEKLLMRLPSRWILVSYNNESLVDADTLLQLIRSKNFKKVTVSEIDYKRNIMCQIGNAAKDKGEEAEYRTENKEYLILIEK